MSLPPSSALPAASGLRLARAVVFAAACGAVSAGGHALAGGGPVPLPVYAAAVLAALGLAYLIDGRERGPVAVLAATTGTQTLLHQLFERLAPVPTPELAHAHPGPGMVLVHLTVAALTAWWLHRGERALWLMIRLYATPPPVIRLLVAAPVEVALPSWRPSTPDVPAYAGEIVSGMVSRRGPPGKVQRSR
ncbi:hypothetical protein [Nonomuraea sp. KM88]|uniref:hypothetical protein n=1 Tax=Nonomuraea sp. KM88 TaxID=3457427 RepID=UPI003FCE7DCF